MTNRSHSEPATDAAAPEKKPGEYVVVARRYRPQTFVDLVGQQHVAKALTGAIAAHRVGHAYLFTGARGVGKTSAARILAKALNCVQGPTSTPCNVCDICESISAGDDVDVLEIDGASNRGIDEIRELRQKVNVRPSRSRSKIYIIDEVHMLTREAFNALLKTLEEPPEHVKFIFCTTEAEKIPITILSRCQRFDFSGIQTPSIAARLRQIVDAEGVSAEPGALEILARRAAGSMRDSQSLLEQLLAFGGAEITVADVHRMLGTADDGRLAPLMKHLVERNAAAALAELDAALAEGVDVGQLLEQLLGYYRDMMVAAVGATADSFLYVTAAQQAEARSEAERLGIETILASMQIVDQTLSRLRYSVHGRTLAELALVRLCHLEDLDELATLVGQVRDGAQPAVQASPARSAVAPPRLSPAPADAKKKAEPPAELNAAGPAVVTSEPPPEATKAGLALTGENLSQILSQVLVQLSDLGREYLESHHRVAICAPNRLAFTFREKYTSSKAFCERPDQVAKLEKALALVTGETVRVQFDLEKDLTEANGVASDERPRARAPREMLQEKSQHPLVRRAVELFDARPLRVD